MRLDKYLKVSRIIKRRSIAKDASDSGIVSINGKEAKASSKVKEGDILEITFGNKTVKIRVEKLLESTKKEDAELMYTMLDRGHYEE
ncbi:MAG: RNA-binding S4 domain-containing protein [Peptostreptococcaceae bacterium]|nr:RNA-binding S4 domain-containing protein [Peptostreptococcaceae bacterium]